MDGACGRILPGMLARCAVNCGILMEQCAPCIVGDMVPRIHRVYARRVVVFPLSRCALIEAQTQFQSAYSALGTGL